MFLTIVLAVLFVEVGLPLIFMLIGAMFDEDENIRGIVITLAIILLLAILL